VSAIPRAPAQPPAHSPHDPRYFEPRDLEAELRRTFQVCHECRMCVNYCGSFPELFARIDRDIDSGAAEGAEKLNDADIKAVGDQCWQCKLCYIKCPYTPDEGAKELLDFPRLMSRERATRARRDGIPLVDRILGEPQVIGQLGSGFTAPMANLVTANQLLRKVQEKVTGISAEFPLPPMATEPFSRWLAKHEPKPSAGEAGEVVLFATCYGEFNTPSVVRAATLALEHNGYRVRYPGVGDDGGHAGGKRATGAASDMLTCCGLPNIDGGDIAAASEKIRHNVALLLPHVRAGRKIVVPSPSCGMMMKREWREYVPTAEVAEVAAATLDLMEFFVALGKEKKLKRDFKKGLGAVAYHAACHLRAQKIGFPGMRVLSVIPDTEVRMVEECSAVDGTWGMKAAHYETGRKYAGRLVRGIEGAEPDLVVTDCSLSALRIGKENKVAPLHPIEAVARAYGLVD
jgi:glycerol-3-phosphate dehydrogenase subunit C